MKAITEAVKLENGSSIELETGILAKQADGAVVLRVGETMVFASAVAKDESDPSMPFLPLSVDYQEKFSSTGKIPGGFIKREGRQNEYEVLASRVVDRSLRPLFPDDYKAEIQVIIYLISSSNKETRPDALACVAASSALLISDIPFHEPVSTVRIGYKNDAFMVNPPVTEMEDSEMDLIVAGTMDNVVMVEGECLEVGEETMVEALRFAHENIKHLNQAQLDMREQAGKPKRDYDKPEFHEELYNRLKRETEASIQAIAHQYELGKHERSDKFDEVRDAFIERMKEEDPEFEEQGLEFWAKEYFNELKDQTIRKMILDEHVRLDGRGLNDVREIQCEVDYLPRAHGSAVFTRGETQSLTTVTLGSKVDEQIIDYATEDGSKRFMLQYRFPPFCTGEVKPMRAPARREIGHGHLAERAVKNMVPETNDYTIRVASDIMESNGSSSMATVCAATLALMDAGVQIKRPVSGIAMGLIVEGDNYAILTDILGDEDHLGDMDFKVTGSREGITACQMDIKVRGLSYEVMGKALAQAKEARHHVLDKMLETIEAPRQDYKPHAPRIVRIEIPADMIGAVIGPGGKVVQDIQKTTGTTITVEEEDEYGVVMISSPDQASIDAARQKIDKIIEVPEVGKTYTGKVVNIRESGAYVEFLPGKDGYLHISDIAWEHIPDVESVLQKNQEVEVQYVGVDSRSGKHRLSRKALLPKPEGYVEKPRGGGGPKGGGRGGPKGGDNRRNNGRGGGQRGRD
jgi:polyribonucleotide nucleotidyltransferase